MEVKLAKLAQGLKGEQSNMIDDTRYDLKFDGKMLHVTGKSPSVKHGPFIVFPANIAYLELYPETTIGETSQGATDTITPAKGRPRKNG